MERADNVRDVQMWHLHTLRISASAAGVAAQVSPVSQHVVQAFFCRACASFFVVSGHCVVYDGADIE